MAATKKGSTVEKAAKPAAPAKKADAGKVAKAPAAKAKAPAAKAKADAKTSPKAPAAGKAAPKKVAPVKITENQAGLLAKIHAAGAEGHEPTKAEARNVESLLTKKLLKRGSKNKATGLFRYHVTKTGLKHLPAPASAPTPAPAATAESAAAPAM